jgi:hypothetical protein
MAICDFLTGVSSLVPADQRLGPLVRGYQPTVIALQFWGNGRWLSASRRS